MISNDIHLRTYILNDTYYHCPISENQWVDLDGEKNFIKLKCELSEGIVCPKIIMANSEYKNFFN